MSADTNASPTTARRGRISHGLVLLSTVAAGTVMTRKAHADEHRRH